ncbi:MAG: GldG family protein [Anaerolineae bacterium]|nr:GldG family protein [Anaerolineae bacterium]
MKDLRRLIIVAIVLLAVPFLFRWDAFRTGSYDPGELPEIDDSALIDTLPTYRTYRDEPVEGAGTVIFDLSHRNNTALNDLTPLRDRIVNRGVEIVDFDEETGFRISGLRGATALVIPSPTLAYSDLELEAIVDFVNDGGRLLLIADPTRTAELDAGDDLFAAFFPESAIPAINSLANEFGIVYLDDYLYNLESNQGNYRNVILDHFAPEQALTDGLSSVVMFAAHSIRSDGTPIISGDNNTHSPVRSGESNLSPAVLSEDGQVFALGDITFLTPPFHTIADNDHFMSNLADWLSTAERDWDLNDFPYLFERPVDVVPFQEGPVDPQFIPLVRDLDEALEETGLSVNIAPQVIGGHDSIRAGSFEDSTAVEDLLSRAGVEIGAEGNGDLIESQDLGVFPADGTTLFLTLHSETEVIIVVMAEDEDSVLAGLEMLLEADFEDCVSGGAVTLCTDGGDGISGEFGDGDSGDPISSICLGFPTTEPLEEGFPRLMSPEESECMVNEGLAISLEFLSPEAFQETPYDAGDVYTYPIELSESLDALWFWGWCTTPDQFENNWDIITITFSINGVEIPLTEFFVEDEGDEDIACRRYYAVVTEWPDGEFTLITEIEFVTDMDDGFGEYDAGIRTIVYEVVIAEE